MIIRHLAPGDYDHVPWKNGGGVSTTFAAEHLAGHPVGDWSGVIWQLGRTRITSPAPFSDLTGFERLQIVIGGSGLVLETPDGEIDLREPFQPVRYDGAMPIISRLENGPVDVINLIARRDHCVINLVCPEIGARIALAQGIHMIHAPEDAVLFRLVDPETGENENHLPAGHTLTFSGAAIVHARAGRMVIASVARR